METANAEMAAVQAWYTEYQADEGPGPGSPSLRNLNTKELDQADIEKRVNALTLTTTVKRRFCTECSHLLEHWPIPQLRPFVPSFGKRCPTIEMEAGARAGCRLCGLLFSQIYKMGLLDLFRSVERRFSLLNNDATPSLTIAAVSQDVLQLWLDYPEKPSPYLPMNSSVSIFKSSIQPQNSKLWSESVDLIDMTKTWIAECDRSHDRCNVIGVNDRPSRLVSVSGTSIKLIETAALTVMPPYATLSYCWGKSPELMLTNDTMASFLDSIPKESLPRTLQDAVEVTRKLNIAYIWIDALCIIQGNKDDWLRESAKMHSVYGGSYVNIAAASAIDVTEGLFLKLPFYNGGFFARTTTSNTDTVRNFYSVTAAKDALQDYHLATRAWAIQEKLLSPRTLYFGDGGLSWECRCAFRSEFLPEGVPNLKYKSLLLCGTQPWEWVDIIRTFTKANLSFGADRLPALSGIAARQQQITGDSYLAGLWKSSLFEQLTWNLRESKALLKPRPSWRAPTWSWASVDGEASWRPVISDRVVYHAKIIDAWTELASPDPFGAVSAGELRLVCSTILRGTFEVAAKGLHSDQSVEHVRLEGLSRPVRIDLDCLDNESTNADGIVYFVPMYSGPTGSFLGSRTSNVKSSESTRTNHNSERREILAIQGLVLRKSGDVQGRFSRVGFFRYDDIERDGRDEYHNFMDLLKIGDKTVAETVCGTTRSPDDDFDIRYSINIV